MLTRNKINFMMMLCAVIFINSIILRGNNISAETSSLNVVKQRQHPFLFSDKSVIERAKERVKKLDWAANVYDKMKKNADKILSEAIDIPAVGGQWYHHYVCKKCGTRLEYTDKKHLCPKCKTEYTGWPYDEVIAGRKHRENMKAIETLGMVYAITEDEKYAKKAGEILLAYAERYTSFPFHDYKGGTMKRGARMLAQTLDESVSIIGVVWGYDLIYSSKSLTDADREKN